MRLRGVDIPVNSEFSIPDAYDEDAQTITDWAHRTLFPVFSFDLGPNSGESYRDAEDFDPDRVST